MFYCSLFSVFETHMYTHIQHQLQNHIKKLKSLIAKISHTELTITDM